MNEITRPDLCAWLEEVNRGLCRAFGRDEFRVLERWSRALCDELRERNEQDPIDEYVCEDCGEASAAMWWPPTWERLCRDCWKREWEAERAAELGGWQLELFEEPPPA